jgi:hypothetical protein
LIGKRKRNQKEINRGGGGHELDFPLLFALIDNKKETAIKTVA